MKNPVIFKRIEYNQTRNPALKILYTNDIVKSLINILDIIIDCKKEIPEKIINNFIDGIALLPGLLKQDKDPEISKKFYILTQPAFEIILTYLKSDKFRNELIKTEIPGDEKLIIDDLEIPISINQIKLHINRLKAFPLTREDILQIEKDLIDYKKKHFEKLKNEHIKTKKKQYDLTLTQIALICVYNGKQITRENYDDIVKEYIHTSTSEKLYQHYTFYCSRTNRIAKPHPYTRAKLINKIDLFESVLEYLIDKGKERAKDEIKILKTILQTDDE